MSETSTTSSRHPRGDDLLSMLADRIGARLTAATVFGTPVDREGITVVPVAVARFGFGAGSGADPAKGQEGEGGGGGGMVTPAGYIEVQDGRSPFMPIVHPGRMLALVLGALLAAALMLRPAVSRSRPRGLCRQ